MSLSQGIARLGYYWRTSRSPLSTRTHLTVYLYSPIFTAVFTVLYPDVDNYELDFDTGVVMYAEVAYLYHLEFTVVAIRWCNLADGCEAKGAIAVRRMYVREVNVWKGFFSR